MMPNVKTDLFLRNVQLMLHSSQSKDLKKPMAEKSNCEFEGRVSKESVGG